MPTVYSAGTQEHPSDTRRVLLAKILQALNAGAGASSGVIGGLIDPVAAPATGVYLYVNTVAGTVWMWNGSAWVLLLG